MTHEIDSQIYRNGFLLSKKEGSSPSIKNWTVEKVASYILHFHPSTNYKIIGNSVIVGDFFSIMYESVPQLLNRVQQGDHAALNDIGGRWALFVLDENPRVYHDGFGGRSVFYKADGDVGVSSHASLLAEYFAILPSREKKKIISGTGYHNRSVTYMPGDLTAYDDVFALIPNNGLVIENRSTFRYWPVEPRKTNDFSAYRKRMQQYIARLAKHLDGSNVAVGVTGGIDSRLLISGLHSRNLQFNGVTWSGEKRCPPNERELILQIISITGLPHKWIQPATTASKTAAINSGGVRSPQSIATMHLNNLPSDSYFITGHGGEVMRGFYNLRRESPLTKIDPVQFFDCYNITSRKPDEHFRNFGIQAFEDFIKRGNYNETVAESGYDLNDIFYWEHRMGMWSALFHSELDTATYSMPGFSDRGLFELAYGMPPQHRLTKNLFAKIIAIYSKELGELQVI